MQIGGLIWRSGEGEREKGRERRRACKILLVSARTWPRFLLCMRHLIQYTRLIIVVVQELISILTQSTNYFTAILLFFRSRLLCTVEIRHFTHAQRREFPTFPRVPRRCFSAYPRDIVRSQIKVERLTSLTVNHDFTVSSFSFFCVISRVETRFYARESSIRGGTAYISLT